VQSRLTDRDLTLLGWLADHEVLTTDQIAHALFPSVDFAQRRLLKLHQAGVLERFRPHRWDGGSYPFHYVLDQLGVDVVAAQRAEEELPRRDQARRRRWWLTNRANLPHRLAVNQFFIDLAGYARTHPDTALARWWPSARCQRFGGFMDLDGQTDVTLWGATIACDGHGVWTHTIPTHGAIGTPVFEATASVVVRVPFFVEVDLGTEDLPRLVGKLDAYRRWSDKTGRVWPVLFWLTSTIRERHFHDRLPSTGTGVPVATAVHATTEPATAGIDDEAIQQLSGTAQDGGPAGPVWWLHHAQHWLPHHPRETTSGATSGLARLRLADLAPTVTDRRPMPAVVRERHQPPAPASTPWPAQPTTEPSAGADLDHDHDHEERSRWHAQEFRDDWSDGDGWHDEGIPS
jgi:hypothetical protein